MKFDFTTIMDRKGKDAIALDVDAALKGKMLGVENVKIATLYPISFQTETTIIGTTTRLPLLIQLMLATPKTLRI